MNRLLMVAREGQELLANVHKLEAAGFSARVVRGAAEANEVAARQRFGSVLWDLRDAPAEEAGLLTSVAQRSLSAQVLAVVAPERPEVALAALRAGAHDYLTAPVPAHALVHRLRSLHEQAAARIELCRLRGQLESPTDGGPFGILGNSPAIERVVSMVRALAAESHPVLVSGRAGTGKSLVARALHEAGPRRAGPWVAVPCGAVRWELSEALLFGSAPGASNGPRDEGCLARAEGGTLVLENIDALPLPSQRRLLGVLRAAAGHGAMGVRLVATVRGELDEAVARGAFDAELLDEIGTLRISLPTLAERGDDVVLLAEHFLTAAARARGKRCALGQAAVSCLRNYQWPGNVRQLRHAVEAALALCPGGTIEPHQLPRQLCDPERVCCDSFFSLHLGDHQQVPFARVLQRVEQELVGWAMHKAGGKQTVAAALLGIPRTTLQSRLARLP